MKRSTIAQTLLLLLAPLTVPCAGDASQPTARPNIVIILADDFGVGDIQADYPENKIPTPHLDRLVRQGRSFTDAHSSSAVCSPTRYGLLTGRYNWRTRLQELYHLGADVGEQTELSGKHPDIVKRLTNDLKTLIDRGTSRHGQQAANDTMVRFDTTQEKRWAPALDH